MSCSTPPLAWQSFRDGRSLDRAIGAAVADRPDLSPAVQDAIYTAVRHLAASKRIVERLAARQPGPDVAALLAVASHSCRLADTPKYVIVDQAVTAARNAAPTRAASGFVNAVVAQFPAPARRSAGRTAERFERALQPASAGGSNVCAANTRPTGSRSQSHSNRCLRSSCVSTPANAECR